jgi:hypothetical protein
VVPPGKAPHGRCGLARLTFAAICAPTFHRLRFSPAMAGPNFMRCDGCGQAASPEHIARRLQRLEWTTRFRPIHIDALLLGAFPPEMDSQFLYAAPAAFEGEAARLLDALGLRQPGKASDAVLSDFQRRGLLLIHVLECPPAAVAPRPTPFQTLLEQRLPALFTRIRRSVKPRRIVLASSALEPLAGRFIESDLGCPIVLDNGKPFALEGIDPGPAILRLRAALA